MLVTDLVNPQELTGFVRGLAFADFTLDRFLPNRQRPAIDYAFTRTDRVRQDMASYRGWDTESPIGKRPGFDRIRGEIPPLSKKNVLGEEQRLLLEQLRNGGTVDRTSNALVEATFADAALLTESVQARIEYARGQVLSTGKVTFTNDAGFIAAEVDYELLAGHIVTAGVLWSTVATADPINDLRGWVTTYKSNNGGRAPGVILISDTILGYLLLNTKIRELASVGGTIPSLLTPGTIGALFQAHGLPPFEVYDTQVSIAGSDTRVTPVNKALLLPANPDEAFGETTFGVTAEALELAGAQSIAPADAPGLVGVNMRTFDPVQTWTKVAGVALPVLKDPNRVMVATVA